MKTSILVSATLTVLLAAQMQAQSNTFPSSGNVGIGTTTPGTKLSVGAATYSPTLSGKMAEFSSGTGWSYVSITNGNTANSAVAIGGASGITSFNRVTDAGVLSESMRIDGSGNVGIGTNSPGMKLEVNGGSFAVKPSSSSFGYVAINPGGSGYAGYIDWYRNGGIRLGYMGYQDFAGSQNNLGLNLEAGANFIVGGGNVGVGTNSPTALLQVGSLVGNQAFKVGVNGNMANSNAEILNTLSVVGANAGTDTQLGAVAWNYYNGGSSPSWSGTLLKHFGTSMTGSVYGLPTANQGTLIFQNVSNGVIASNGAAISISPLGNLSTTFLTNGNVGIGTTNPTQKLAVNGTVRAKEVIVDTGWSDYVFEEGYHLAPLSEVERHIKAEKHLPGIPSAAEVAEHGVSMGDMQSKLLAKIEEITLRQIAQEKEIAALRSENASLRTENAAVQSRLDKFGLR